jgi:hypothetical protein
LEFEVIRGWRASLVLPRDFKTTEDFYRIGKSSNISNAEDKETLIALRKAADVIVTTGKTARDENYRGSKHAPIAVLTKNPETLAELDLFTSAEGNFIINCADSDAGLCLTGQIAERGFTSPLFEGGLSVLQQLAQGLNKLELVLSITGSPAQEELTPELYVDAILHDMTVYGLKTTPLGGNLVIQASLIRQ